MFDTFPYDEWSEDIAGFWTWGPGNSTGTYILTVLGIILMVVSIIGWVMLEQAKLDAQVARLRAAGGLPLPGIQPEGDELTHEPPLAGPSIDPGP
jgi:hypothetical protein